MLYIFILVALNLVQSSWNHQEFILGTSFWPHFWLTRHHSTPSPIHPEIIFLTCHILILRLILCTPTPIHLLYIDTPTRFVYSYSYSSVVHDVSCALLLAHIQTNIYFTWIHLPQPHIFSPCLSVVVPHDT